MLSFGEPAPWFTARSTVNPNYQFDTVAGRYIVLCFFGSADDPANAQILAEIDRMGSGFDIENFCFFGVSTDPDDERLGRLSLRWPGVMFFWDFDHAISKLYGVALPDGQTYQRQTIVLDQALRTLAVIPFEGDPAAHVPAVIRILNSVPPIRTLDGIAPVLIIPHIFERLFCQSLIEMYERFGGQESGYMKEVGGKTVQMLNPNYKRRTDYVIQDPAVIQETVRRLQRRLIPEIKKVFQYDATYIERYIVSCYDAATGGFFKRHRDHTTKGTAHRRFAVSINLNAEDYEGGDLWFPEFGQRNYRAPTGGAVVFSCALTHEVRKMTRGKRYAFLPFLYNVEGEQVRQMNLPFLDTSKVHVQS